MLYCEWASKVNKRAGVMVAEADLPKLEKARDAGFRSAYLYDETAAKEITALGSSKDLSRFTPHSNTLFIDLDNGDKDVPRLKEWAKDTGANLMLYSSGGKGNHAHIKITPMEGKDICHSQLKFVESIGVEHDPTIYRQSSLIALPGRVHPKTKKRKQLVESVEGNVVTVPMVNQPVKLDFSKFEEETDQFQLGLQHMVWALYSPPRTGGRFMTLWSIAKQFADSNVSPHVCYAFINEVNKRWPNPKEDMELQRAIRDAYKTST